MGATLSLQAPHAQTVAVRSYVDVLQEYQFLSIINNTRFLKTIKAYDSKSNTLVVIKVLIKPPQSPLDLKAAITEISREAALLEPYCNILGWNKMVETDSAGYLVRQLGRTNLYDRMSMAPFLCGVEKLWLVYQLAVVLSTVHDQCGIVHGDLKTENLLVTGGNWLVVTDFSAHTKPALLPENNPSEYAFYFDSSNRRTCYLAPERFYSGSLKNGEQGSASGSPPQDMFSFGCVVMELYQNGEPAFTLSDLYKYKKGEFPVNVSALPDSMQEMVQSCLSLDPKKRPRARDLLENFIFPSFFAHLHSFLYELNTTSRFVSTDHNKSPSDLRIEHIFAQFGTLFSKLGIKKVPEEDEKDSEKGSEGPEGPEKDSPSDLASGFPHYWLAFPGMQAYRIKAQASCNDGCLILLNAVLSLVSTLQRPENKVKACELILALSEHIPDEAKLDRSVPYLFQMVEDFLVSISQNVDSSMQEANFLGTCHVSSRVASVALVGVTNLLETCTSVNSINVQIFPEYIVPKLRAVAFMGSQFQAELDHVKKTMASCFPYLVRICSRFDALSQTDKKEREAGADLGKMEREITEITESLLTSANVDIRISLVNNLLPLCQYFGVDKTNDVILPHLITYLNDASYQLRLAFLSSLIGIGNFIGILAFEQYLIPLLLQTLGDHEVLVVLKALEIFVFFVREKLIMAEFNALSIYKELLQHSLPLVLQPNEWIRQSVMCLVLAVSENLSDADRFCFLYPLIKTYLAYDISVLTWDSLYPCWVKPVSHRVFELSLTWLHKSTAKSLFWKQKNVSIIKANGKKKLVSYSKDLGRSVYLGSAHSPPLESPSTELPLSSEDRSWVLKLKAVGLDIKDLWKVFALKDFLVGISRSRSYSETGHSRNFELASTMNIPPKTVFFDVRYKTELIEGGKTEKEATGVPGVPGSSTISATAPYAVPSAPSGSGAVSIPSTAGTAAGVPKKASASLQTSQMNAFGEIDSPLDPSASSHDRKPGYTRMVSISNDKIITSTMRHNFGGSNPYILQYLENMQFQPTLDDFGEFGPVAKISKEPQGSQPVQGKRVVRFKNNANSNNTEAVTKISVAPFSEFFVSGSETGVLRVWDSHKVEMLNSGSARLTLQLEGAITEITFMSHRFVFAAATTKGQIGVFRVHIVRGKNRKIIKISKLSQIRDFTLSQGFATTLEFIVYEEKTLLVALTSQCAVVAYDVITGNKEYELLNPPSYGIPKTLISNSIWLLLGTSEGILCLYDMRFRVLVNAWKVKVDQGEHSAIEQLVIVPEPNLKRTERTDGVEGAELRGDSRGGVHRGPVFGMVGGGDEPEVTLWEIPEFECRQVLSSSSMPKIRKYSLQKVQEGSAVSELFADLSLDLEPPICNSNTCLVSSGKTLNQLVTATADKRVVVWDIKNIPGSVQLGGKSTFYRNQVTRNLAMSYERIETRADLFEDEITAIGILERDPELLVVGDRTGTLSIFR